LIIEAASEPHEVGVKAVQEFFEDAMRAQQAEQDEHIEWTYGTNATHGIEVEEDGRLTPSGDKVTPDGAIYGPKNPLTLVTEIANSQTLSDARMKISKAMEMPSVVGGILVNLEESPVYASPKGGEWKHKVGDEYISAQDYYAQVVPDDVRRGPREIQGFQFVGKYTSSMEVMRRNKPPVSAVSAELKLPSVQALIASD